MDPYNHAERPVVYNTYQFYRWEMLEKLFKATSAARKGYFLGLLTRATWKKMHAGRRVSGPHSIRPKKYHRFNAAVDFAWRNRNRNLHLLGHP